MKKLLIISTVDLNYNGITSIILSLLKEMNKEGFDIYITSNSKSDPLIIKQFREIGLSIVELPSRKENTFMYFWKLMRFIKANKIDIIHAHGNSATLYIEMLAGIMGNCPHRIAHSHNTQCQNIKLDKILRPFFYNSYTTALACGESAGKWLFNKKPFLIIQNGRNISKYTFNLNDRIKARKELNLDKEIVIGHVGEFNDQKNHKYIIKVFKDILELKPDAKLLLIGEGPLKKTIIEQSSNISNSIIFLGKTDKVNYYLNAMDGTIFPSLYEGLPLAMVEWQINGLPIICSENITKKCSFSENIEFLSLKKSSKVWARTILKLIQANDRVASSNMGKINAKRNGFDIKDSTENLRNIYLKVDI